jgi:hypothetical protein
MALRSDFLGKRVGTVFRGTFSPCDVSAKQGSTSGSRALTGDSGELGRGLGELKQGSEGSDEGSETRRGRGETSSSGEVVVRCDTEGECR